MFNKGNNYGKGRPKGSQNKLTTKTKDFLKELLFDENKFLEDYAELDTNQRMELRIKLAPTYSQKQIQNKTNRKNFHCL